MHANTLGQSYIRRTTLRYNNNVQIFHIQITIYSHLRTCPKVDYFTYPPILLAVAFKLTRGEPIKTAVTNAHHLQQSAVMPAYFSLGRNSCKTVTLDGHPPDYTHSLL
jgi:hypothetical protein